MRRLLAIAAASLALTGASVATAPAAQAGDVNQENCIVSKYTSGYYRAWCGAAATGTHHRIILKCQISGAPSYYYRYGAWQPQGSRGLWSYARCDTGHYVVQTLVQTGTVG